MVDLLEPFPFHNFGTRIDMCNIFATNNQHSLRREINGTISRYSVSLINVYFAFLLMLYSAGDAHRRIPAFKIRTPEPDQPVQVRGWTSLIVGPTTVTFLQIYLYFGST